MSRDGSRHRPVSDNDPNWEQLMLKGVSALTNPARNLPVRRLQEILRNSGRANPAAFLLRAGRKWLQSLPEEVQPLALATRYARIVNNFAHQWNDHAACAVYVVSSGDCETPKTT